MNLDWKTYDINNIEQALRQSFCLYFFHHPDDGDRPFYIGKAKYFGASQDTGYNGSARYNTGYVHLIYGMLRSGFNLYISHIGEDKFNDAECYEQELIAMWNPVRPQRRIEYLRKRVSTSTPWRLS